PPSHRRHSFPTRRSSDLGLHVMCDQVEQADSLATARALADAIRDEEFDVLMAGTKADDYGTGQVGLQVAELLGIRHFSSVIGFRSEEHTSELQSRFDLVC